LPDVTCKAGPSGGPQYVRGAVMARETQHQSWTESYRQAVMEANPRAVPARIQFAKAAIRARFAQLKDSEDGRHELASLNGALKVLHLLEKAS